MELAEIKGIGINTIRDLNSLGINDIKQLVTYYPFRYEVIKQSNIEETKDGDKITISGMCENIPVVYHFSKKLNKMSFRLNGQNTLLNITIFNRSYLKQKLKPGVIITITGKYDKKHKTITASDIIFEEITKTIIEPVYHASSKLNSKKINKIVKKAINNVNVLDYIPKNINKKYKFPTKNIAIKIIHFPTDLFLLEKAKEKLKYEELFIYMLKMNHLKSKNKILDGLSRKVDYDKVKELIKTLPFELTVDQLKATKAIYNDLIDKKRMNRLLQGDVGSGKTIVSFISLYINYLSGYQGALMAPTEILASQHYENIKKILPELKVSLLTGKLKAKEKKEVLKKLKEGKTDIIIGTHALISDDVIYNNLGLVITDEQHRFGVNQRANLKNKGITPDILYMSATPIPRTYALTLYGDMDISSIKTMPSGRKQVKTILKTNKEITDVLYMMLDELKKGRQIYVIAPLIETSEKIDMENVYELEEKMQKAFSKVTKIGVLHGKMKNKEKDEVMQKFVNNEIGILISTTVIEVGVDIKNATMMVIFDSYRFGLSALHQLRGRVGRNEYKCTCVLISDKETKRLKILTETADGFKVSEEDFFLRGSGDLFGIRQSGDMYFKLADLKKDYDLLLKAKEDSEQFLKSEEYKKEENSHIRKLISNSSQLD